MEFILKSFSIVNGPYFNEENNLKLLVHIITAIKDFPIQNKFEQIDYNIILDLPKDKLPEEINQLIPSIAQDWINRTYVA